MSIPISVLEVICLVSKESLQHTHMLQSCFCTEKRDPHVCTLHLGGSPWEKKVWRSRGRSRKGVLLGVFRGSAGGSRWCWQGLEEEGGLGVLDLTSGSCNDCSMMVCECRSGGG